MASLLDYEIVTGELIIRSTKDSEILWKGRPKGYNVAQVIPIEGSRDCIVLLDWLKTGLENRRNLMRLDNHGNIMWEVGDPPKSTIVGIERGVEIDSYTGITSFNNFQLIAYTYSGFSDHIDIVSGAIIRSEFAK